MEYHSFPFLLFCRILKDKKLLEKHNISDEDWNVIEEKYNEKQNSSEVNLIVEAFRKVLIDGIKLNKYISLMKYITTVECDWEEFFKLAKVKYTGDKEKDFEYLLKLLNKSKEQEKIYKAQFEQLEQRIKDSKKDQPEEEFDLSSAYETISSIQIHGFAIPDYETLTLGQIDGMTATLKKKFKK